MNKLTREQISGVLYKIKFNDIELGEAIMDVDGYFYFWYNKELTGFTQAWVLRAIADLLDEINKPWDEKINEYFEAEKAREKGETQTGT